MAGRRTLGDRIAEIADKVREAVDGAIGALAPQPDRIPVPVRDDPRRPRR